MRPINVTVPTADVTAHSQNDSTSNMTYAKFKEHWLAAGLPLPTKSDMSQDTIDALVAASEGDLSYFDRIASKLEKHDAATPHQTAQVEVEGSDIECCGTLLSVVHKVYGAEVAVSVATAFQAVISRHRQQAVEEAVRPMVEALEDHIEYTCELLGSKSWMRNSTVKNNSEIARIEADIDSACAVLKPWLREGGGK